eukprot:TRINITY_DN1758_c0_g1_i1.p1 TRINITY_DN1758_c0_g1~~TRINITY_DN1758_c0_g1_i1.p1  ORF type:complete len:249 (+),score=54.16 TRINITY_DN1758_c0_g1_i1:64-810(+)
MTSTTTPLCLQPLVHAESKCSFLPSVTHLTRASSAVLPAVSSSPPRLQRLLALRAESAQDKDSGEKREGNSNSGRREILLNSSTALLLASVFHFSGPRPKFLGVQRDPPSLALCPATPNCISTSEELNDPGHYVPPWTYNPEDGRGRKNPATQEQAFAELFEVVTSTKPDGFEPKIVEKRDDYLYVEYESPFLGFVDDVEFWFPPGPRSLVEYRSASRLGESDFDINRKRIKFLRQALEKKGWRSIGF